MLSLTSLPASSIKYMLRWKVTCVLELLKWLQTASLPLRPRFDGGENRTDQNHILNQDQTRSDRLDCAILMTVLWFSIGWNVSLQNQVIKYVLVEFKQSVIKLQLGGYSEKTPSLGNSQWACLHFYAWSFSSVSQLKYNGGAQVLRLVLVHGKSSFLDALASLELVLSFSHSFRHAFWGLQFMRYQNFW